MNGIKRDDDRAPKLGSEIVDLIVLDKDIREEEPEEIDEETNFESIALEHENVFRLIGDDSQQFFLLDFKIMPYLFDDFLLEPQQGLNFLPLCGS